jgi:hypothetical protein
MTSIVVGLVALALAVLIQRLVLVRRARGLKAREQAFRFHAIRDELQALALKGVVDQDDSVYRFVMWTTNLYIRNAGVIKLRDILRIARAVDSEVTGGTKLMYEVKRAPEPLQRLVGDTFTALVETLVANDYIVRAGLAAGRLAARTQKMLRPAIALLTRMGDAIARLIAPTHAEAVEYARKYDDWGGRLQAA